MKVNPPRTSKDWMLRGLEDLETRSESIRTLISLSVRNRLNLHQMDITATFLNGELDEEIYMKQPKGLTSKGTRMQTGQGM